MYKYLFGPVPSRRLGMSLGVDLVPHKVCTLNCVYCECGATTKLTLDRKEYVPYRKVISELEHYFTNNPDPDYITFSGSGEPTLNSRIGDVLDFVKLLKPDIPIAVLTNGTLLFKKQVRNELMKADIVLPSLDAVSEELFRSINRPASNLDILDYIKGLKKFRNEFQGEIWLEILILPGYNDKKRELRLLKEAIGRIRPNRVQLNTLDRPGTIVDLNAASYSELQDIVNSWGIDNVEIIAKVPSRIANRSYRKDIEEAILETILRRPCTVDDLANILGLHVNEINKYLGVLEEQNKIERVAGERGVFYKLGSEK